MLLLPITSEVSLRECSVADDTWLPSGRIELTLVVRLRTGQASRHDLAVFLDEVAKCVDIFVIDLFLFDKILHRQGICDES